VKKVHLVEVGSSEAEAQRLALPEQVQLAMFEIAESAKEGLLALAVGAGLAVLHECMEHEVGQVVGPKGRHNRERVAKRHGRGGGEGQRARQRAKAAAADIARELIELYARRRTRSAHAFSEDLPWQSELENSFPYPETPDQLRAELERHLEHEEQFTARDNLRLLLPEINVHDPSSPSSVVPHDSLACAVPSCVAVSASPRTASCEAQPARCHA